MKQNGSSCQTDALLAMQNLAAEFAAVSSAITADNAEIQKSSIPGTGAHCLGETFTGWMTWLQGIS